MSESDGVAYQPINTLKPVCDDVWIVDGPTIRFGMPWPKMSFPTRMTIVRIGARDLFVHSPTEAAPSLLREIEAIGAPRWIVGPNRIHYWWTPDWRKAFPQAQVYLAPRTAEQAGERVDFDHLTLDRDQGYPWDGAIATLPVTGSFMTEVEFFHRASRTLILTDFIENFERRRLGSLWMRLLAWFGGVLDPDGSMPRDMRLTFRNQRAELKAAIETMIGWDPERVIIAHGRWYRRDGAAELRRAFRWLVD